MNTITTIKQLNKRCEEPESGRVRGAAPRVRKPRGEPGRERELREEGLSDRCLRAAACRPGKKHRIHDKDVFHSISRCFDKTVLAAQVGAPYGSKKDVPQVRAWASNVWAGAKACASGIVAEASGVKAAEPRANNFLERGQATNIALEERHKSHKRCVLDAMEEFVLVSPHANGCETVPETRPHPMGPSHVCHRLHHPATSPLSRSPQPLRRVGGRRRRADSAAPQSPCPPAARPPPQPRPSTPRSATPRPPTAPPARAWTVILDAARLGGGPRAGASAERGARDVEPAASAPATPSSARTPRAARLLADLGAFTPQSRGPFTQGEPLF